MTEKKLDIDNSGNISKLKEILENLEKEGYTRYYIKVIDYGDCERWVLEAREK